jgi:uncharacterized protein RhaS with RHS repeats
MKYDGLGRRVEKAITNSGDWNFTYRYYYDGDRLAEERDGSDVAQAADIQGGIRGRPRAASLCPDRN